MLKAFPLESGTYKDIWTTASALFCIGDSSTVKQNRERKEREKQRKERSRKKEEKSLFLAIIILYEENTADELFDLRNI